MNDTLSSSKQEVTGRPKHSVSGPVQMARGQLLHNSRRPLLPHIKQY
jgi:hypothetical protein